MENADTAIAKVLWEQRLDSHNLDGLRRTARAREDLNEDEPMADGRLVRERGA